MPAKKKTKLSKAQLTSIKPYYIWTRNNKRFNLKRQFAEWVKETEPDLYDTEKKSVYWRTIKAKPPKFRKGLPYFVIEEIPQLPYDTRRPQPINHFFNTIYFVKKPSSKIVPDERVREAIVETLLDHEFRERTLERAGYTTNRAHQVATARERRDLERRGILEDYLNWLKEEWPFLYEQRINVWKNKKKAKK